MFGGSRFGRRGGGGLLSPLSPRARLPGTGGSDPYSGGDFQDNVTQTPRRPPPSPIYEGGGPFASMRKQVQPPKQARDKLYDRMCDWELHTIDELESWMPEREWFKAMLDLNDWGFAFDREGVKIRLRKKLPGERRQSFVALLSGVTLPNRLDVPEAAGAAKEEPTFFPEDDQGEKPPEEERMSIDEDGALVLSAPDLVTETVGILARKGMGKTYLAMVIAEEFLASSFAIPFVVIDPTGVWWGLLADARGEPSANQIVVFGGEHGHYPLEPLSGKKVAELVIAARPLPVIIDLSGFTQEEQHGFCADFAAELYQNNKEAIHVFIDEADVFAPQRLDKSSKHQKRSLSVINTLIRRGRVHGLGATLITQRPAVINKDVLSQIGIMFFLQMISPQDLDAVENWLHGNIRADAKRAFRDELPVLGRGVAYYMRGGEKFRFSRFRVRAKTTFDSSFTPRMGDKPRSVRLAELDADNRALVEGLLKEEEPVVSGPSVAESVLAPSPVPVLYCLVCGGEQMLTPSGMVCTEGHVGAASRTSPPLDDEEVGGVDDVAADEGDDE